MWMVRRRSERWWWFSDRNRPSSALAFDLRLFLLRLHSTNDKPVEVHDGGWQGLLIAKGVAWILLRDITFAVCDR